MAKKKSPVRQAVLGLLIAIGGWSAFFLTRNWLNTAVWEGLFGVTNKNAQALFTFLLVMLVVWVSIGAPFTKKGFIKAFDKVV